MLFAMFRKEISAGCVVYRIRDAGTDVVLIQPRERDAWSLPKGLIEPGETSRTAAARETREETGLLGQVQTRIGTIRYSYIANWEAPPIRIFKVVTFYLLRQSGGDVSQHDHEVDRVEWFPIEEAIRNASYARERNVLRKAQALIQHPPAIG
jgi:8-oxo-dGTP pyrophosphatase MutT (NUDIX family)